MHCNKCCDNHRNEAYSKTYSVSVTAEGETSFTFSLNCPCECHDVYKIGMGGKLARSVRERQSS